jgi:MFS family permease
MRSRSPLLPIFLIVLVDILGLTMVWPLLPLYATSFGASPLVATLLSSVYAFCSLLSGPVIGRLGDTYGRRRLLLLSQLGTFGGFLMLAAADSLVWLFVGRIIDGVTAGNLSLAQAYISDHTTVENRARSFGIIGVAFGIGFMFGPAISGQLAKIGMWAPFVAAAALSATSVLGTYFLLPRDQRISREADDVPAARRVSVFAWRSYAAYFSRPGLSSLLWQFFVFQFAFACFTQVFALFASQRFFTDGVPWGPTEVGMLFGYSGLLGIILQGGLIGRLVRRHGEARIIVAGFVCAAVAYVLLGLVATGLGLYFVATIAAAGNGVLRPAITARITQVAGRHEQGAVLGVSQSLAAAAITIAPPIGGALIGWHWLTPWALLCSVVAGLGVLLSVRALRVQLASPARRVALDADVTQ